MKLGELDKLPNNSKNEKTYTHICIINCGNNNKTTISDAIKKLFEEDNQTLEKKEMKSQVDERPNVLIKKKK